MQTLQYYLGLDVEKPVRTNSKFKDSIVIKFDKNGDPTLTEEEISQKIKQHKFKTEYYSKSSYEEKLACYEKIINSRIEEFYSDFIIDLNVTKEKFAIMVQYIRKEKYGWVFKFGKDYSDNLTMLSSSIIHVRELNEFVKKFNES